MVYFTRGLKYVSRKRKERIKAITDYICLPKQAHASRSAAAAHNGLSMNNGGTWRSDTTTASTSNSNETRSSGTDDETTPLQRERTRKRAESITELEIADLD
jgi:hypothetical protein